MSDDETHQHKAADLELLFGPDRRGVSVWGRRDHYVVQPMIAPVAPRKLRSGQPCPACDVVLRRRTSCILVEIPLVERVRDIGPVLARGSWLFHPDPMCDWWAARIETGE